MRNSVLVVATMVFMLGGVRHASALVVCAKDDGTGQPKPKSKLSLEIACTPGKQVAIGIAYDPATTTVQLAKTQVVGDLGVTSGNLQVTSGSGSTDGAVNGYGNIIVGYNEANYVQFRTGSHNIIVGREHSYTSFGGLVVGDHNAITGAYASVSGGNLNTASGVSSSVSGGSRNIATASGSSVSGGSQNGAEAVAASVTGGFQNSASGLQSVVQGGLQNSAMAPYSSVSGGFQNTTSGNYSSIAGGLENQAVGAGASIGGGSLLSTNLAGEWHAGRVAGYPTASEY